MRCYIKDKEEREEISRKAEEKILAIIEQFHIRINWESGFDANSDNGMQDMHYGKEYQDLKPENFVVDGDEVVGYKYADRVKAFDGTKEILAHTWDDTEYGGSTDVVDRGEVWIVYRK